MPKIETNRTLLYSLLDYQPPPEFPELSVAKAELDTVDSSGENIKIELNDTNRPDLWSTAGLARQLNSYYANSPDWLAQSNLRYSFLSTPTNTNAYDHRIIEVDPLLLNIRPYIVAFEIKGPPITEVLLKEIIQSQEKICTIFGRKRRSIAMGIYRASQLQYPLHYVSAQPSRRFAPLGMQEEHTLKEIIENHPKGKEYGHIIAGESRWPLVCDNSDTILSMPPVINSNTVGNVQVGDTWLLVELTGNDLPLLITACNIMACDCADMSYTIFPVATRYPYPTKWGTTLVAPLNITEGIQVSAQEVQKRLGSLLSPAEIASSLLRMGFGVEQNNNEITAFPPAWRNDCMHEVDVIEDVMIGWGIDNFTPLVPTDVTIGRLLPLEERVREVLDIMIGLGFQEMIFNYLVSGIDFIEKMYPPDEHNTIKKKMVEIANPLSEKYSYVRNSIIPHLLSAESQSAHAVYPHHIFEVGKVAQRAQTNYGSTTNTMLGFLSAHKEENFNLVNERLSALMYYLEIDYTLTAQEDSRFLSGRCATIIIGKEKKGILGEVHPQVLENWNIEMPGTACELMID